MTKKLQTHLKIGDKVKVITGSQKGIIGTISLINKKKIKEQELFKNLKKEVNTGANGTQGYIIKKGINKGKKI